MGRVGERGNLGTRGHAEEDSPGGFVRRIEWTPPGRDENPRGQSVGPVLPALGPRSIASSSLTFLSLFP